MTDRKFAVRILVYLVLAVLFSTFGLFSIYILMIPIVFLFGGGRSADAGWIGVIIGLYLYPLILLLILILLSRTIASRIAYLNLSKAWIPLGIFYAFVGVWSFYSFRWVVHRGPFAMLERALLYPGFHQFLLVLLLVLYFHERISEETVDRRQKSVLVVCYIIAIHQFLIHRLQFLDIVGIVPSLRQSFLPWLHSMIAAVWPSRDIVFLGLSGSTILWAQFVVFTFALASLVFPPGRLSPKQAG